MDAISLDIIKAYYLQLQEEITVGLEALESAYSDKTFAQDSWERPEGGGGRSRVLSEGAVFEKAGVGFSHVHGSLPAHMKAQGHAGETFDAMGVSLVIHPRNPFVPVIHMNIRHFRVEGGERWFGGGIDLSPAYVIDEDAIWFHDQLKQTCAPFGEELYPAFKTWCDEYFTIKHRGEMRGIGGIFYDYLGASQPESYAGGRALPPLPELPSKQGGAGLFAFNKAIGNAFVMIYTELVTRNWQKPYDEAHKRWQHIRRGRYTEFNLVYDRGTTFGLQTNGRVESILMSLPPQAAWLYNHQPEAGSLEAESLKGFQPKAWA